MKESSGGEGERGGGWGLGTFLKGMLGVARLFCTNGDLVCVEGDPPPYSGRSLCGLEVL